MKRLLATGAIALGLATTAACGTTTDEGPRDVRASEPAAIDHPVGATDVVLQVSTGGGYTSLEYAESLRPAITLYGDGTLITEPEGADEGINTRMLRLRTAHVDDSTVQQVLRLADDAGLLADPPDYDMADGFMVTDNPTTTVTLRTDDGTFTHAAYALGFSDGARRGDTDARRTLRTFIEKATASATHAARFVAYTPSRVKLYVNDETGGGGHGEAWPADLGLDLAGRGGYPAQGCHDVTPEQADALSRLVGGAAMGTLFREGARLYSVIGVQMLPGEKCSPGR